MTWHFPRTLRNADLANFQSFLEKHLSSESARYYFTTVPPLFPHFNLSLQWMQSNSWLAEYEIQRTSKAFCSNLPSVWPFCNIEASRNLSWPRDHSSLSSVFLQTSVSWASYLCGALKMHAVKIYAMSFKNLKLEYSWQHKITKVQHSINQSWNKAIRPTTDYNWVPPTSGNCLDGNSCYCIYLSRFF